MIGRREFGILGLAAAASVPLAAAGLAQNRSEDSAEGDERDQALQSCSQACSACQRACDSAATHCARLLAHDGVATDLTETLLNCLLACLDCADFCAASAQITARGGPLVRLICQACADACAACAQVCEQFPDDRQMARCAEECHTCEESCRDMLKML